MHSSAGLRMCASHVMAVCSEADPGHDGDDETDKYLCKQRRSCRWRADASSGIRSRNNRRLLVLRALQSLRLVVTLRQQLDDELQKHGLNLTQLQKSDAVALLIR